MPLNIEKLMLFYPNTLLSEFLYMFGRLNTEKLLMVFAGTTLQVPTIERLRECERDIIIYETIRKSKSAQESVRLGAALCKQYDISRSKMRCIYRDMLKRVAQNEKLRAADKNVGQHTPQRRVIAKRRTRWTM